MFTTERGGIIIVLRTGYFVQNPQSFPASTWYIYWWRTIVPVECVPTTVRVSQRRHVRLEISSKTKIKWTSLICWLTWNKECHRTRQRWHWYNINWHRTNKHWWWNRKLRKDHWQRYREHQRTIHEQQGYREHKTTIHEQQRYREHQQTIHEQQGYREHQRTIHEQQGCREHH